MEMTSNPWIGPNGEKMERLELHLTYTCPERCVFCSEDHRMKRYKEFPVTWGRVATVLRTHAKNGVRNIHITGGEPTIHPRFTDVLQFCKKLGMRTSVGTIGTMLSRPEFAEKALPFLDEALFSIHGPSAEVHDSMAGRKGSFDRVTKAFQIARDHRPTFGAYVNTVVTRHNVDHLPDTVQMADQMGAKLIVVSNTTPEGAAFDQYKDLAVPLEKLKAIVPKVMERSPQTIVRFFGIPVCLLGEHSMLSNDLHWDPRVTVEWGSKPGKVVFDGIFSWKPDRKRTRVDPCQRCDWKGVCMGVYEEYGRIWPNDLDHLEPISLDKSDSTCSNISVKRV